MKQSWQQLVLETAAYHKAQQSKFGVGEKGRKNGWSLRDTAKILCKSLGWVSETLQLAEAIKKDPKVAHFVDRQNALNFIHPGKPYLANELPVTIYSDLYLIHGKIVGRGFVGSKEVYLIETESKLFSGGFSCKIIAVKPEFVKEKK